MKKRLLSFFLAILMLLGTLPSNMVFAKEPDKRKLDVLNVGNNSYFIKFPGVDYTKARYAPEEINKLGPDDFEDQWVGVNVSRMLMEVLKIDEVTLTIEGDGYKKNYVFKTREAAKVDDEDPSNDYPYYFGETVLLPTPKLEKAPSITITFPDGRDSRVMVEANSVPTAFEINIGYRAHTGIETRWFGKSERPDVQANYKRFDSAGEFFDLPKDDKDLVLRKGTNWTWANHDQKKITYLNKVDDSYIALTDHGNLSGVTVKVDGKDGQGQLANSKYYFKKSGDAYHGFNLTMREKVSVDFEAGKGTWKAPATKPATQYTGHSLKLGESFTADPKLGPVTVPNGESDLTPPKAEADKPENVFKGWATTADGPVIKDMANFVVEGDTTFYAIYGPKDQGKIKVQYKDLNGTTIDAKYKLSGVEYPTEKEGNKGEAITNEHLNGAPAFLGYKFKQTATDPVPNPPESAKYTDPAQYTLIYKYEKLDSIIPEDKASDDVKKTYTKVTFAADTSKGKLKLGATDGGAKKVYYVNPVEGETIENVRAKDNITAAGIEGKYKVDDTTPWKFAPDEIDSLTTVITTQAVTVNANFVKEKGTVTYVYEYKNETSITNPSKTDIPPVPTDAKEYEVDTKVTAETTVAKDRIVPVKNNEGTTIGNWKFSGWDPAELTVKKNSQTVKNEFKGTWTFTEAGKHGVTYEFKDMQGNALPTVSGELNKFPGKPTDDKTYYTGQDITLPTTPAVGTEVKGTNGNKQGTWKFDGWYNGDTKLTETTVKAADENKFVGKWTFTEDGKKDVEFSFKFYNSKKPTEEISASVLKGKFEPTVPAKQTDKYVGSDINLPTFEDKVVNTGDLQGTWKFDGWYRGDTKLTDAKVSATDAENKLVGKWILTEAKTAKVTRKFVIDPTIMGDGKDVPTGYELPDAVKVDQKVNDTTNYIGSEQTPGKDNFKAVPETINGKQGTWTFKEWDKTKLTVNEDENKNVFTGTWTWGAYKPEPKDIKVTVGEKPNPQDGIKDPNLAPPGTTFEWKNGQPDTSKPGKTKVTILVKIPGSDPIEVETNLIVTEEPVIPAPPITWKGYWYLGDSKTEPVQPKTDMETGRHYKYLYGYVDKTVRPEGMITRSEAAALIARLANLDMTDKTKPNFKDTPSAWYNGAINAMVAKNLMFADKDGNFRPNEPITRGEFARALYYIDKKNDKVAPFADVKGHEFEDAINQAYGNGRIAGYQDGTFKPNANIQRAEAARILNQFADRNVTLAGMANVKNDLVRFTDINESHWAYCEVMEAANSHEYQRVKGTLAETWLKILDK